MKCSPKCRMLTIGLLVCLAVGLASCTANRKQSSDLPDNSANVPAQTDSPVRETEERKPSIPSDAAAGTEYLYDFTFAEQYDRRVTDAFSLAFPAGVLEGAENDTLFLLEGFPLENVPVWESVYQSDGLLPHKLKDYRFDLSEAGSLYLTTDFYEPDDLEYIRSIWTDLRGAKTNLGVGVGSSEQELLAAYPDKLYYLSREEMEPAFLAQEDAPACDYEYAYAWRPFSAETNEIRDITFYLEDGAVAAIELVQPYELRYVYGLDSEAALQKANENRETIS